MDDGTIGKREGMDRAERSADPHWWACMLDSAIQVALRKPYFNTDDVVAWCREHHPNATTHELRAIGPLMNDLVRREVCKRTHSTVESTQAQCHKRPMRVWWSLIYRGPAVPMPRQSKPLDPRGVPFATFRP